MYDARKDGNANDISGFIRKAENPFYRIDSNTIPLKWYLGTAYFSQGRFPEAEDCFEEAFTLTPYNLHVLNNLASCYEINGKRQDAIDMYLQALKISPLFEEARLNLAAVFFNSKDYKKAFQTIDRCDVETRDPKYKTFLPVILKARAQLVIDDKKSGKDINSLTSDTDFVKLYYDSKKNNITFESQIINHLNK